MAWLAISLIEIVRYGNKQWDAWHQYTTNPSKKTIINDVMQLGVEGSPLC